MALDDKFWLDGESYFSYSQFNIIPVYLQFYNRLEPRHLLEGYRKIGDSLPGLDRKWTLLHPHEDYELTVYYYDLRIVAMDIADTGEFGSDDQLPMITADNPMSAHACHLIAEGSAILREEALDLAKLTRNIARLRTIKLSLTHPMR